MTRLTQSRTLTAIHGHHAQLAASVDRGVRKLHEATEGRGDVGSARDALSRVLQDEVFPHAVAEERTLYAAAAGRERTTLLISAMVEEHRRILALGAELSRARTAMAAAGFATAVQAMLETHLAAENDVLLPALVQEGVDLEVLLAGMHEILAEPATRDAAGMLEPTVLACGYGGRACAP